MKIYRPINLDEFLEEGLTVQMLLRWHMIDPDKPLTIAEAHMIASDLQRWLRRYAKAGAFV